MFLVCFVREKAISLKIQKGTRSCSLPYYERKQTSVSVGGPRVYPFHTVATMRAYSDVPGVIWFTIRNDGWAGVELALSCVLVVDFQRSDTNKDR